MSSPHADALRVVSNLVSLTAVGVGALYAVGAWVRAAELRAAGVRVQDALPLIPVEQLLARGIATMAASAIGVLAVVVGLMFITLARQRRAGRGVLPVVLAMSVFLVGFLIGAIVEGLYDPVIAATAAIACAAVGYLLNASKQWIVGAALAAAVIALLVRAWFFPLALPLLAITTTNGKGEFGALVAHGDNNWYLTVGAGVVFAIPDDQVRLALVGTRSRAVLRGRVSLRIGDRTIVLP